MVKLYIKSNCKTCQKAVKYLEKKDISFEAVDIMSNPPATWIEAQSEGTSSYKPSTTDSTVMSVPARMRTRSWFR